MTRFLTLYRRVFMINAQTPNEWIIPSLARFTFGAVLLLYFWSSAKTKLGQGIGGIFSPSLNAYVQIFPQKAETLGYDIQGFSLFDWAITLFGTWAEFILPALIVLGLFTRVAALGMIGFILVQSFVDVQGHGVSGADFGMWFDAPSGSLIMDQRLLWGFVLSVLLIKGGGQLSLDRWLKI